MLPKRTSVRQRRTSRPQLIVTKKQCYSLVKLPVSSVEYARVRLDQFAKERGIKNLEAWYNIKFSDITASFPNDARLRHLGRRYGLCNVVSAVYPNHEWHAWKFVPFPKRWWKSISNQRTFLQYLANQKGITCMDDWYTINKQDIKDHSGAPLLQLYEGSVIKMLQTVFPQHNWDDKRFTHPDFIYWSEPNNIRRIFDEYARNEKFSSMDDWYNASKTDFLEKNGSAGRAILLHFDRNFSRAIMQAYPDHPWKPWKIKGPIERWADPKFLREFFDDFAQTHNITSMDNWYLVQASQIIDAGGSGLVSYYRGKISIAVQRAFPDHKWIPELFGMNEKGTNPRTFFDWLGSKLGINDLEQWYSVHPRKIVENGGRRILKQFNSDFTKALSAAYPHHKFYLWRFEYHIIPSSYWKNRENLQEAMKWIAEKLNIVSMEDWYQLTWQSIKDLKLGKVITHFSSSPYILVSTAFPNHTWLPWKFSYVPKNFWRKDENVRKYCDWLMKELNMHTLADWYSVTIEKLQQWGASLLRSKEKSLSKILECAYPDHRWDHTRLDKVGNGARSLDISKAVASKQKAMIKWASSLVAQNNHLPNNGSTR